MGDGRALVDARTPETVLTRRGALRAWRARLRLGSRVEKKRYRTQKLVDFWPLAAVRGDGYVGIPWYCRAQLVMQHALQACLRGSSKGEGAAGLSKLADR